MGIGTITLTPVTAAVVYRQVGSRVLSFGLRSFSVAVCLACAAKGVAQDTAPAQDVLVFANGDRLTGKLLRGVKDSVVFHSDVLGDVTVPLAKIKEMQTSGTFAVLRKGAPVRESEQVQPVRIDVSTAGVLLQPVAGPPPPVIPFSEVAYIVDGATFERQMAHKARLLEGWSGTVTAGASVQQSTQHGGTVTAAASFERQVPSVEYLRARNKTTVNVQESYGTLTTPVIPQTTPASADAVVKTSIFHADAERDEYFSPKGYGLANATFDHNYSQGLQLQQTYGVGVGYTVFATPVHHLELKADAHYQKEQFFLPSQNLDLVGSTFAENYRVQLPRKLVLTEVAAIDPAWNNLNAYAANGTVALAIPVLKRLSANVSTIDSFINNPSPGYKKNSLQFITGLTYVVK